MPFVVRCSTPFIPCRIPLHLVQYESIGVKALLCYSGLWHCERWPAAPWVLWSYKSSHSYIFVIKYGARRPSGGGQSGPSVFAKQIIMSVESRKVPLSAEGFAVARTASPKLLPRFPLLPGKVSQVQQSAKRLSSQTTLSIPNLQLTTLG